MNMGFDRRLRILAFWHGFEFETLFREMFLDASDYDVEVVCGGNVGTGGYRLTHRRLWKLLEMARCGEFDLIVASNIYKSLWPCNKGLGTRLANCFRFSTFHLHRTDTCWAPLFARESGVPMAVIDFRDAPFVLSSDWPLLREATLYFKRELPYWPQKALLPLGEVINFEMLRPHAAKFRSFSWGIPASSMSYWRDDAAAMEDRDIDVFMSGSGNPIREELFQRCLGLARRYPKLSIVANPHFISEEEYREKLRRAKIVLCTESHGCENHRQYDVVAAGAVPAINWPNTQSYLPFLPGVHAIYFSMMGENFENTILKALGDREQLKQIVVNAREFVKGSKQRRSIARYVVESTLAAAGEGAKRV